MGPGDRVRGQLAYYGAFRTGRFAGRLIQPQNFPRAAFKTMRLLMRYLVLAAHVDVDFIRLCWGNPLDAVASALRGCLIPAVGKVFIVRDLSQIEARVIAWLAGQQDILDVFAAGKDVYTYTQILLGLRSRQEGKVVVLGLGFGMGPGRFQENAASNGLKFTAEECEHIVKEWRAANPKIVQFWWDLDNAAKNVIGDWHAHPAHPVTIRWVGKKIELQTSRARNGSCLLTILLPSGRRLYYRNARLEQDPDNAMRVQIVYSGVDTYTKKWTDVRTYGAKLAENITQAVARDVIVEAALRVDAQNLGKLVLSVHDELLFEVDELDAQACEGFISVEINARPNWAPDLPVASEGGILRRYGK
jgi:DNA polymerase